MKDIRRAIWEKAKGVKPVPGYEPMQTPEPVTEPADAVSAPIGDEKREGLGVAVMGGGIALMGITGLAERAFDLAVAVEAIGIGGGFAIAVVGSCIAGGALMTQANNNGGQ